MREGIDETTPAVKNNPAKAKLPIVVSSWGEKK
jgi:hypothetical protein